MGTMSFRVVAPALLLCLIFACGDDDGGTDAGPEPCTAPSDCDDGMYCNGAELCAPGSPGADDRGCLGQTPPCGPGESCDEATRECGGACSDPDADGDGDDAIECGGSDCDDTDPTRFSGAEEICDPAGVDEDCDPSTVGDRDLDGDGYVDARCCNGDNCGEDCDETRRGTNPDVPEVCDRRDNDCDGEVDEGLLQDVFADRDRDLHGDPDTPLRACPGRVGTSASSLDCDDDDPTINGPQSELDDGLDNDCDDAVDEASTVVTWYEDADGDGYGDPAGATMSSTSQPDGFALLPLDCDDSSEAVSPRATEICNGIDDDCSGDADFEIGVNDWEDDDGDGFADMGCGGNDCDDTDPITYMGAPERCDRRDNDCDGSIDERCDEPMGMDAGTGADAGTGVDSGPPGTDAGPPPECEIDADCDDGVFCNGMETCNGGGMCEMGEAVDCDDADSCTRDRCDVGMDMCVNEPACDIVDAMLAPFHRCAIRGGALYCWGNNGAGRLGIGTSTGDFATPQRVGSFVDWTQVCGNELGSCGVRGGFAYCWGSGANGRIGDGATAERNTPTLVPTLSDVARVECGTFHTCAITTGGAVHCWGRGSDGSIGTGTSSDQPTPVMVGTYDELSVGHRTTCAQSGTEIYCWGFGVGSTPQLQTGSWALLGEMGHTYHVGAISTGGQLFRWDPRSETPTLVAAEADHTYVATAWISETYSFRSGEPGTIRRSDGMAVGSRDAFDPGTPIDDYTALYVSYNDLQCGRRMDGRLFCWMGTGEASEVVFPD